MVDIGAPTAGKLPTAVSEGVLARPHTRALDGALKVGGFLAGEL